MQLICKNKLCCLEVFLLTGKHAQLLVIAVSFLCLQLHSFDLPTPPSGLPASEWRLNTTGSSWTTGSSATQFWICWGRSRPSCVSGGELSSRQRLSGCCYKSGMWAATQPHATLWPQTLAREDNTCKEILYVRFVRDADYAVYNVLDFQTNATCTDE